MDELIHSLEKKIKTLIQQCELLQHANVKLSQNKLLLLKERELLMAKNKLAVSQIEHMVSRLKSLEQPS